MKVAIFIASYNKRMALTNTLYSIGRQKTTFPFQVCVVDDGSDPNECVMGVVDHMIPHTQWRYTWLHKNVGCKKSQIECLRMMDPDTDIIVLQSSDVLYAGDDVLEKLVTGVEPMVATMAEVRNVFVPHDLWREWDNLPYYLQEERLQETLNEINSDPRQPERGKYKLAHTIFSGPRQPNPNRRWYFFLGAIRTKDLIKTCFRESCYDVDLSASMHREGISVKYIDVVGYIKNIRSDRRRGLWQ